EQAEQALGDGADYLSVSPLFGTATKPDLERPAGLEGLRRIRAVLPAVPLVAIGGIQVGNVAEVIEAGADGVAFISAMSAHPEQGVRAIAAAVRQTRSPLNREGQLQ
ncbi:MAG: thiamine phosphate synthase, partial [Deltaproteobacteria bacterium]